MPPKQAPSVAGATRIPTVHVYMNACGVKTVLPIKVDQRMMVDQLRELAKNMYATYCQDEGVPFNPPSQLASDYDLFPCTDESGNYDPLSPVWPDAGEGGPTVRELLVRYIPPVYVFMTIGWKWIQRDELFTEETKERLQLVRSRSALMDDLSLLNDISMEKQRSLHLFRERQGNVLSKVEDALLLALVEYRKYETKLKHEHTLLEKGYALWREQLREYEEMFEKAEKAKRMLFSVGSSAVVLKRKVAVAEADEGENNWSSVLLVGYPTHTENSPSRTVAAA